MEGLLGLLGIAAAIALAVWAFWNPIMKIIKSWLETVKVWQESKEAQARRKKTEKELEQTTQNVKEGEDERRNQLLLQEAKEKQRQQYPRGNITWPEAWYRENFIRRDDAELESFISFLKRKGKL